jgi:hypothetical protein
MLRREGEGEGERERCSSFEVDFGRSKPYEVRILVLVL